MRSNRIGPTTFQVIIFLAASYLNKFVKKLPVRMLIICSKTSFGIVYDKGGFFVHMWAQVYVGQWVTIDATITNPHAQINVGPTHIALNTSSLKDVNNLSELMKAADKFNGQLKLKLIEYELDGQTKKPAKNP